ncbi:MAG: hypothetical protein ACT4OE_00125 [Sphingosinicella sp.]
MRIGMQRMAYYRLYLMSPHNGHIESVEEFEAHDDEAAIARLEGRSIERPAELWASNRKVRRYDAGAEQRPQLYSVAG